MKRRNHNKSKTVMWQTQSRSSTLQQGKRRSRSRRGAASVEFAVIAPVFVIITLGVAQASQLFNLQNQLSLAAREGARLAAMDRTGLLQEGQTTNDKIELDVRNFLTSNGIPGNEVQVYIVDPDDHTTRFDLDDPDNELGLFELRVELPCSAVPAVAGSCGDGLVLSTNVVFRNARSIVQ